MYGSIGKQLIAKLIILTAMLFLAELLVARVAVPSSTQLTVASKRTRNLVITIMSADGRLTGGENSFCVEFRNRATQEPIAVLNVAVDFTLLVGRIQEQPIRVPLVEDQNSQYCGRVNLGKQYYDPASYYIFVHYADSTGKKRKQRLFVSINSRPGK
jgi:hypothetical protein